MGKVKGYVVLRKQSSGTMLQLFFNDNPVAMWAESERVPLELNGERVYFLSAEAITLFKITFNRPQDWVDIDTMIRYCGNLDTAQIDDGIKGLFGNVYEQEEIKERMRRWKQALSAAKRD